MKHQATGTLPPLPPRKGTTRDAPVTEPATEGDELGARIVAAAAGDEDAFATLYRTLQPRLLRYAVSLVGQDAEDVTAEAWLQIARDIRSFSGDTDAFRGWTARIVRNRALDQLRARARRPVQSTGLDEIFDAKAPDNTEDLAVERIFTDAAIALIASLPRDQREAVMLRAVVGLDAKSAGLVLGKSAAAVRVAAHRGLKNLGKRLAATPARSPGETQLPPRALNQ
ncbi:MAG TPA: RNA polymerase sigma factor [Jatrophihabitantaceae bacterium]|jgi:RNA polymerase sigma-70 factor (ECF subfamily)|nr:RNA polymerase sigma factor [Jatrophihabitantaceae bacterium]